MVYRAFGVIHAFAFGVLLLVNLIIFNRERADQMNNRPLEQRQEVSAIYKINSSELFPRKVLQKRFQRFSESTAQSGSSNTFHFNNDCNFSTTFSRYSETGSNRDRSPLNFAQPRKSSLRNSTSTASPTISNTTFNEANTGSQNCSTIEL